MGNFASKDILNPDALLNSIDETVREIDVPAPLQEQRKAVHNGDSHHLQMFQMDIRTHMSYFTNLHINI